MGVRGRKPGDAARPTHGNQRAVTVYFSVQEAQSLAELAKLIGTSQSELVRRLVGLALRKEAGLFKALLNRTN